MKKMYKNLILLCCMTVFSLGGVFAQANDLCANAEALVLDAAGIPGDNTGGTSTADAFGSAGAPEVWYEFNNATAVNVTFETVAGTMTDSQIALYDACGGLLILGDDDGGAGNMSLISDFCAEAGVSYFLEVQGWNGAVGDFTLSAVTGVAATVCDDVNAANFVVANSCDIVDNLTCTYTCIDPTAANFDGLGVADCAGVVAGIDFSCCIYAPGNDLCVNATVIGTAGAALTGTNEGSTATADGFGSAGAPEVWYTFVGNGNPVTVETFEGGTMTDSQIAIYDACGGLVVASDDDGGDGAMSLITGFCAEAAVSYFVEVQGWNGQVGTFDISVLDEGVSEYCDDITATNYTDPVTVDACAVVNNTVCVFGVFGCADAAALNFLVGADSCDGVIGGTDTSCCEYPPANDDCAGAIPIICGDVLSGTSVNSTVGNEVLALECGTVIEGPGVWYSYSSPGSEELLFSTCGSALDTKINVYTGSCGAYVCAGGNDDDCGVQSNVTVITPAAATDYFIHISGWNGNVGLFDLALTCGIPSCTPPLNDVCDSALPLPDATAFLDDNACAQANDLAPSCAGFGFVDGVWYSWDSGANNAMTLDFGPAAVPSVGDSAGVNMSIAVFGGNCANPTEIACINGTAVGAEFTGLTLNTDYLFLVFTDEDVDQGQFDIMITGGVSGCATVGACNYDPAATIDDGSCDLSCLGCTNILALNYDGPSIADGGTLTDNGLCVVPGCDPLVSTTGAICYDNLNAITWNILENTPGEGTIIEFTAGAVEAGFDVINIFDELGVQLNTQLDGDLTGLIFQSAGTMSIDIISDTSFSCATGEIPGLEFTVYCGALEVVGCFDPTASNYNADANSGDQVAICQYLGCTDALACNFNDFDGVFTDDGTCCLLDCITVTVGDVFGDGGTTVALFDDLGTGIGSVSADGEATFCVGTTCVTAVITADGFPEEAIIQIVSSQSGVVVDYAAGSLLGSTNNVFAANGATGCIVSGCVDPLALNFCPLCNADCLEVLGGTDPSCCVYPVANNDCDGAIALTAGVEENWDTTLTDDSGNNCSPTLINDVWYLSLIHI